MKRLKNYASETDMGREYLNEMFGGGPIVDLMCVKLATESTAECLRWFQNYSPRAAANALQKKLALWKEIRETLTDFDDEAELHAQVNGDLAALRLRDEESRRQEGRDDICPTPDCGGRITKKNRNMCRTCWLRRKELLRRPLERNRGHAQSGSAQGIMPTVKTKVELPGELLTFLESLKNKGVDVHVSGDWIEGDFTWTQFIASLTAWAVNAYSCWPSVAGVASGFTMFAMTLPLKKWVISALLKEAQKAFSFIAPGRGDGVAQSGATVPPLEGGLSPTNVVTGLCTLCITTVSAVFLGKMAPYGDVMSALKNIGFAGRALSGIKELSSFIQECVTFTFNYIKEHVFGCPPEDNQSDIDKWCDEVMEFKNSDFERLIKNNKQMKARVDSLLLRGDKLLKYADKIHMPLAYRTRMMSAHSYLTSVRTTVATSGAGCCDPRVPPIIIHLVGDSGVGKSAILWPLMAKLLAVMGCTDEDDLATKIYFKYPTQDNRWDGFSSNVLICVADDAFMRKDSETNPSQEPIDAVRMCNVAFFQLEMAHLADKGNTCFQAPVVLWTSNEHQFKFPSLTNAQAVERRITARYRQYPRPEFAKTDTQSGKEVQILDMDKVSEELKKDPMNITKFVLFDKEVADLSTRQVLKQGMTYEEVSAEIVEAHLQNMERGESFNDAVRHYFRECAKATEQGKTLPEMSELKKMMNQQTSGKAQSGFSDEYKRISSYATVARGNYVQRQWNASSNVFDFIDRVEDTEPALKETWNRLKFFGSQRWFACMRNLDVHVDVRGSALHYDFAGKIQPRERAGTS